MNAHTAKITWRHILIIGALALVVMMLHPEPLPAETDACALLTAADVAPLLGGTPTHTGTPQGQTCTWTGTNAGHKLLLLAYKNSRIPGEAAYMGARQNAGTDENAKVKDETGIGDKAFSGRMSFGAIFMVLKKGRLLQLQYWTGSQGTSQDVDALRPVVKKAVAAF